MNEDAPGLKQRRERIDRCDAALLALIEERRQLVAQIAAYKDQNGLQPRDPAREAELLQRAVRALPGADAGRIEAFHRALLALCRPD